MPAEYASGTETAMAHGLDRTSTVSARPIHLTHSPPKSGGSTAITSANITTAGVYIRAKRAVKRS